MKLLHGDCLDLMPNIPDGSIDMVMTDPPYGTTACKWDSIIPLEPMWEQLKRLIKPNGAILLFGQNPFTSVLVTSQLTIYRYNWCWVKNRVTGHANANKMPMKNTEDICVFYKALPTYNPQGLKECRIDQRRKNKQYAGLTNVKMQGGIQTKTGYPKTTLLNIGAVFKTIHPTQKPVPLMEYLIKTYTNDGGLVLDFAMGSGTTGVACQNLGREFIGIEKDDKYFEIAQDRILGLIL